MRLLDSIAAKIEDDIQRRHDIQKYGEVARILWFDVAYNNVLANKREKMNRQQIAFATGEIGPSSFAFGPILALTSSSDVQRFIHEAKAELLNRGYGHVSVSVYPNKIIVSM